MTRKIFSFLLLIALLFRPSLSLAGNFTGDVAIANNLYIQNKFQPAADAYESLIQKGVNNGYLYYNLGNTYIRLGKIGPAILNYIRAQKLIPRDENLQANLNFAIQQTHDKIPLPPQSTISTFFFWVDDLNLNENIKLALIVNLMFWLILAAWFYYRSDLLKLARNVSFVLLFIVISGTGIKMSLDSNSNTGVVLTKKTEVKSGLDLSNVTLFELHEGALVTITDRRQGWLEIKLNAKQKGWVPENTIGV